jgi:hypothetical protein
MLINRTRNTVLQWPIYYAVPASIQDKSRYKNNGTLANVTWETRPNGLVVPVFNGASSIITVTDSLSLRNVFDTGGTIMAWIKPSSDGENSAGIIFNKDYDTNVGWILYVSMEAGGLVNIWFLTRFSTQDGTWYSNVVFPINVWSLVTVTYTAVAAGTPIFYMNSSTTPVNVNTPSIGTRVDDGGHNLYLGNRTGLDRTFDGSFCIAKIRKGVILSHSQILEIYLNQRKLFGYG